MKHLLNHKLFEQSSFYYRDSLKLTKIILNFLEEVYPLHYHISKLKSPDGYYFRGEIHEGSWFKVAIYYSEYFLTISGKAGTERDKDIVYYIKNELTKYTDSKLTSEKEYITVEKVGAIPIENIDKIKFSKEDFQMWLDSNKFGL